MGPAAEAAGLYHPAWLLEGGRLLADETLGVDVVSHGPLCRPLAHQEVGGHPAQGEQPLPLLLHQLLRHQDRVLDAGDGADTPEQKAAAVHQAGIHLHGPGLGQVGPEPGVCLPRVLQHHRGLGGGVRCAAPRPQDIDPSLASGGTHIDFGLHS